MELELLLARIAAELATAALDLWTATATDPAAYLPAAPPVLAADETRRVLARAGSELHRVALAAAFAGRDRARTTAPAERTETGFLAAAAARAIIAERLGFADLWSLALATLGDATGTAPARAALAPLSGSLESHLADPRPLVSAVARAHGIDPAVITHVSVTAADAPEPGRTFVIDPHRDLRIRVWRRPDASAAGTLRVLLHEVGHAVLAASSPAVPPPRAFDEGVAAWFAAQLEDPAFNRALGLSLTDADALATAERTTRAARRARLLAAAAAEQAFYAAGGPAPWRDPLAWTDPGAAAAYAAAESLRDSL